MFTTGHPPAPPLEGRIVCSNFGRTIRRWSSLGRRTRPHYSKIAASRSISHMQRCGWARNQLMIEYHDKEWGVPIHNDRKLFEFLLLEGAQAGLSWETVLKKRANYRDAFDHFDPIKISHYKDKEVRQLLGNAGIIRNRLKIEAAIVNAQRFLEIQKEFGAFDQYVWQFVGSTPIRHKFRSLAEI